MKKERWGETLNDFIVFPVIIPIKQYKSLVFQWSRHTKKMNEKVV